MWLPGNMSDIAALEDIDRIEGCINELEDRKTKLSKHTDYIIFERDVNLLLQANKINIALKDLTEDLQQPYPSSIDLLFDKLVYTFYTKEYLDLYLGDSNIRGLQAVFRLKSKFRKVRNLDLLIAFRDFLQFKDSTTIDQQKKDDIIFSAKHYFPDFFKYMNMITLALLSENELKIALEYFQTDTHDLNDLTKMKFKKHWNPFEDTPSQKGSKSPSSYVLERTKCKACGQMGHYSAFCQKQDFVTPHDNAVDPIEHVERGSYFLEVGNDTQIEYKNLLTISEMDESSQISAFDQYDAKNEENYDYGNEAELDIDDFANVRISQNRVAITNARGKRSDVVLGDKTNSKENELSTSNTEAACVLIRDGKCYIYSNEKLMSCMNDAFVKKAQKIHQLGK